MPSTVTGFTSLEVERIGLGERVAALGYAPVIQEFLKKGCPQCLRAKLWAQVLGADVKIHVSIKPHSRYPLTNPTISYLPVV